MKCKHTQVTLKQKYTSHQSSQQNGILLQNYHKNQICTGYMIWDYNFFQSSLVVRTETSINMGLPRQLSSLILNH